MLHDWPSRRACLTKDGYIVLPAQSHSEPPPARAMRTRTHCAAGHPFSVDNTLITLTGRRCLECLAQMELPLPALLVAAAGRRWAELPA